MPTKSTKMKVKAKAKTTGKSNGLNKNS